MSTVPGSPGYAGWMAGWYEYCTCTVRRLVLVRRGMVRELCQAEPAALLGG